MTVSSLAQTQQIIQNLGALNNQSNTLSEELSSGLTSQTYAGIASQAGELVNMNAVQAQQQGYIDTINSTNTTLSSMSLATSTLATLVGQFGNELQTNAFNTTGTTVQSQAQALLSQVGDYLNTQDGEGYIFSGSETTTAPYDPSGLPNPGSLTTAVNGAPPAGYYAGDNGVDSAQVDTNLNVQYGITAANPAFEQAIRALNFIANSGSFSQSNATDVANVSTATNMLSTAATDMQQLTAQIGEQQSELNTTLQVHQQSLTLAQGNISNIEQANTATVITQINALQTQIEASYQTVNILQNLSLANYLK